MDEADQTFLTIVFPICRPADVHVYDDSLNPFGDDGTDLTLEAEKNK